MSAPNAGMVAETRGTRTSNHEPQTTNEKNGERRTLRLRSGQAQNGERQRSSAPAVGEPPAPRFHRVDHVSACNIRKVALVLSTFGFSRGSLMSATGGVGCKPRSGGSMATRGTSCFEQPPALVRFGVVTRNVVITTSKVAAPRFINVASDGLQGY